MQLTPKIVTSGMTWTPSEGKATLVPPAQVDFESLHTLLASLNEDRDSIVNCAQICADYEYSKNVLAAEYEWFTVVREVFARTPSVQAVGGDPKVLAVESKYTPSGKKSWLVRLRDSRVSELEVGIPAALLVDSQVFASGKLAAIHGVLDYFLKLCRQKAVDKIVVTVDGIAFDGDETSQTRMSRAIAALDPGQKTFWKTADNLVKEVSREQLRVALAMAGQAQTNLWFI